MKQYKIKLAAKIAFKKNKNNHKSETSENENNHIQPLNAFEIIYLTSHLLRHIELQQPNM